MENNSVKILQGLAVLMLFFEVAACSQTGSSSKSKAEGHRSNPSSVVSSISSNSSSNSAHVESSSSTNSSNSSVTAGQSSSSAVSSNSSLDKPAVTSGGVPGDVLVINDITVPPDPGIAAKSTLGGVDSNSNGVRDEVERELAAYFGDDLVTYTAAFEFARKLQIPLSIPVSTNEAAATSVTDELIAFECFASKFDERDKALSAADMIASRTYNTKSRYAEHSNIFDLSGITVLPEIGDLLCD